ncbi:MAG: hypothetical protein LBB63_04285 [Holosporaceae bacterium]|jgi:hypothetical protein|nr:hypothetical protein [Holosporaceae bacterium]
MNKLLCIAGAAAFGFLFQTSEGGAFTPQTENVVKRNSVNSKKTNAETSSNREKSTKEKTQKRKMVRKSKGEHCTIVSGHEEDESAAAAPKPSKKQESKKYHRRKKVSSDGKKILPEIDVSDVIGQGPELSVAPNAVACRVHTNAPAVQASAESPPEIMADSILEPTVDSSKFESSSVRIDAQQATSLAHNSRRIQIPTRLQSLTMPSRTAVVRNVDDELRRISDLVAESSTIAGGNVAFDGGKNFRKTEAPKWTRPVCYRINPKEVIRLRQELEQYHRMYAEKKENDVKKKPKALDM